MYRDEQFAEDVVDCSGSPSSSSDGGGSGSDRRHFDEILSGYRLILTGKRVDPVDIRVKTGWWADSTGTATSSCGSAGKVGHRQLQRSSPAHHFECANPPLPYAQFPSVIPTPIFSPQF